MKHGDEALAAGLLDIHLPPANSFDWLADLSATVSVAAFAALVVALVFRAVSERKKRPALTSLQDQVAASKMLPTGEQRTALLHLLKRHRPKRFAGLQASLYKPSPDRDLERLIQKVLRD